MSKVMLHLSIDSDLREWAKISGMNLSAEFEEWIRIKRGMNMSDIENNKVDYDKEYTRLQMELRELESKKELAARQSDLQERKNLQIDRAIDQCLKDFPIDQVAEQRKHGIVYIWKSAFNENITEDEALQILENRIKERNLCQ